MLTLRLTRVGKKKKPTFRLIVSEKARDTVGTYLELLGHVNPHTNPSTVVVKADRVKYWLSQGASASPTVHNLLVEAKIIDGKKIAQGRVKKSNEAPAPEAKPAPAPAPAEAAA
jgi:small subunit ribosomal protein S16